MIGLIFKLTLCVRLLLVYKRLLSFFRLNAFINVYYNFFDVYHIYDKNFVIISWVRVAPVNPLPQ